MRKRFFARRDVWAAFNTQGHLCGHCERAVPFDLIHGDHIVPHSAGGSTTIANLQALCGSCNLRKGNRTDLEQRTKVRPDGKLGEATLPMRAWQAVALAKTCEGLASGPQLISACPGAGKTRFGLEVAHRLAKSGEVDRVLVLTHTTGIKGGWIRSASGRDDSTPTIPMCPVQWQAFEMMPTWAYGAVATYQGLRSQSIMFAAHLADAPGRSLLILDEAHHLATDRSWGVWLREIVEGTNPMILLLSGTPFRTDSLAIAFAEYVQGTVNVAHDYSYADALLDGVCQPVAFSAIEGTVNYVIDGTQRSFDIGAPLHASGADQDGPSFADVRGAALSDVGRSSLVQRILSVCDSYIPRVEEGAIQPACLVVCSTIEHADSVAALLSEKHGAGQVQVVHSDVEEAASELDYFRTSDARWLVAVGMVNEGVDIPRLRCLGWLTNATTDLLFQQLTGRIIRRGQCDFLSARVVMPAFEELVDHARSFMERANLPVVFDMGPKMQAEGSRKRAERPILEHDSVEVGTEYDVIKPGPEPSDAVVDLARRYVATRGLQSDPFAIAKLLVAEPERLSAIEDWVKDAEDGDAI